MFDYSFGPAADLGASFDSPFAANGWGMAAVGDIQWSPDLDSFGSLNLLGVGSGDTLGQATTWDWSTPSAPNAPVAATDWNFNKVWQDTPSNDSLGLQWGGGSTNIVPPKDDSWFSWSNVRQAGATLGQVAGGARQLLDAVGSFTRDAVTTARIVSDTSDRLSQAPRNINAAIRGSGQVQNRPTTTGPRGGTVPTGMLLALAAVGIGAVLYLRK